MPRLSDLPTPKPATELKIPQVRALVALMPDEGDDPPLGSTSRYSLASAAGFNPSTGTLNRVLNGIREGSSSGAAHPGVVELGLVEIVTIDLDGQSVDSYRITRLGIIAVRDWLSRNALPPTRDAESCTNHRYADDSAD